MGEVHKEDKTEKQRKIKSVFCFAVSPQMRGQGVATELLQRVVEDAREDGFDVVEAYPNKSFQNEAKDFMGPGEMYRKQGFQKCYETEEKIVFQKDLHEIN